MLKRLALLCIMVLLTACPKPNPPKPPEVPHEPQCQGTTVCDCWHRPPGQDWQFEKCPPQPPQQTCSVKIDTDLLPPPDNDTDWTIASVGPLMQSELFSAVDRARAACPELWSGDCLAGGAALIDSGFTTVTAELHARGIKAGKQADALFVGQPSTNYWEEWHIFYYKNGCLANTSGAMKNVWLFGGPVPKPTPSPKVCTDPIPPKVGKWKIVGHHKWFDTTPLFYGAEYCLRIMGEERLWCPARNECKDLTQEPGPQNYKCEERVACESAGVGGLPLWRCEKGPADVNTANAYQARCGDDSAWIEVCSADGAVCTRQVLQ